MFKFVVRFLLVVLTLSLAVACGDDAAGAEAICNPWCERIVECFGNDAYIAESVYVADCLDRGLDGSILVFRDPTKDPKWSFARVNEAGLVTEVAEKKPISDLATVGIYLFSRGRDFVSATADMMAANDRVNGEFYTCPVYNYMIRSGARIGVYEVPMAAMAGLGTPEDLSGFLRARGAAPSADAP